jgi:hypothetical protein
MDALLTTVALDLSREGAKVLIDKVNQLKYTDGSWSGTGKSVAYDAIRLVPVAAHLLYKLLARRLFARRLGYETLAGVPKTP